MQKFKILGNQLREKSKLNGQREREKKDKKYINSGHYVLPSTTKCIVNTLFGPTISVQ
jgi:hypothetical protein